MSWEPELQELRRRQAYAREMGGTERVQRQHDRGLLTVRERIDRLLDRGSFLELGSVSGQASYDADGDLENLTAANCVFGRGKIHGRAVTVTGDDFTIRGGSADAAIWAKFKMAENMAYEYRLPLIRLVEGSGGGGSVRTLETSGRANLPGGVGTTSGMDLCVRNLAQVPVVAIGQGSVAGLGAARLVASHLSIMVKETAAVFVAGPPVVERLGERRTKQELGGHAVQTKAGTIDLAVDSEDAAFEAARRFLSYLPSSVWELPPRGAIPDDTDRRDEFLLSVVPRNTRQPYRMRPIIEAVTDRDTFFELGQNFGSSLITGLARMNGWPVAVMAGDPFRYGGAWTATSSQKLARFIDLAETFHLPVIHLADCPGFQVGLEAEASGVMRHAVRAISAINQCTVPWCSILVRNVFGVGGGAHQPAGRLSLRYAWPSGRWGSLPLEGGVAAAYSREISAAADPEAETKKIEERLARLRSPFRTAEAFLVEEIIDPRDTRRLLCDFADLAAPLRTPGRVSYSARF
ncbi:methylmalonyl-CoA carboxyltransferase [Achromobacter pestifer]|uniref:Methylmalonyl-CoA carboxyltransferase n=1 Tax=Achromobacter pestifer TaxID=1353889 RepID=A0A7D4DZM4_9BURK|nr:carboxyl transferase domain-containing protein [Achromobacter pestifer]QKH37485.1 methylmalonyl-CoA carboxyltransferase [Achromobacter pestifer]